MNNWYSMCITLVIAFAILLVVTLCWNSRYKQACNAEKPTSRDKLAYALYVILLCIEILLVCFIMFFFLGGANYNSQKKEIDKYLGNDIIQVDLVNSEDEIAIFYKKTDDIIGYVEIQFDEVNISRNAKKVYAKSDGWHWKIYVPLKYYNDNY